MTSKQSSSTDCGASNGGSHHPLLNLLGANRRRRHARWMDQKRVRQPRRPLLPLPLGEVSEVRQRRVWRYYCGFCKKAGCQKAAIVNHEERCTGNPNRICGMCKWNKRRPSLPEMKEALAVSFARLRFITNCPACILATIKQSGKSPYNDYGFEYGVEAEKYWEQLKKKWEEDAAYAAVYG